MPRLNFDISFRILDFATRGVTASLMGTCRTLNREGTKHLFKYPVALRTNEQVVSFVRFFVAREDTSTASYRYPFLRSLSVYLASPSKEAAAALTFFFTRIAVPCMTNFTHLELHHPEQLLGAHAELGSAISSLSLLQSIKVTHAGPLCGAVLEELRSPLVKAYVDIDWESRIEKDIDVLLHNARHTLRELDAYWTNSFDRRSPVFRDLHRLSLNYTVIPSPRTLKHVCPNLRHLHINQSSHQKWLEMQEIRDHYTTQHSWPSLHVYSGSANVLYMLHLPCHVSRVNIYDEEITMPPEGWQDILLDTTPTHLLLTAEQGGASYFLNQELVSLFSQPAFWHWPLKTLELVIKFRPLHDEDVPVVELLANILSIVAATQIRAFRLKLDVSLLAVAEGSISGDSDTDIVSNGSDDDSVYEPLPDMVPLEHDLEGLNLEGVADLFMKFRPSLETVIITLSGHTTRGSVTYQKGPDIVYDADNAS